MITARRNRISFAVNIYNFIARFWTEFHNNLIMETTEE